MLVDVQFAGRSHVKAGLDDVQDFALQFRVLPGQVDLFLGLAHGDVVRCHVAQQGDQHGVVVLDRCLQLGLGTQHLTAVESPEVQFPGQVESEIPLVTELGKAREKTNQRSGGPLIAARGVLRLGENFTLGDSQLSPGLEDAGGVLLQIDVLVIGMMDQIVEYGVVENGPPAAQVSGVAPHADIGGIDPLRGDGGLGRTVLGPHLEAVVNVVRNTRASAQANRRGYKAKQAGVSIGMPHGDSANGQKSADPIITGVRHYTVNGWN